MKKNSTQISETLWKRRLKGSGDLPLLRMQDKTNNEVK